MKLKIRWRSSPAPGAISARRSQNCSPPRAPRWRSSTWTTARRAGRGCDQRRRRRGRAVRRRCLQGRRRRRAGRGSGRPLRPHRYSRQQCRDLRQQAHLRHHRGGMGSRAGGHAQEPVPHEPARRKADGGAGLGGRIVNIGSTSGFMGRSRAVAYSAAKGGVANLTRAMAAQLAPHKIRVNAIVPNKIGSPVGKDEFDPTRPVPNMPKRPGEPAEAAKAVLFLASEDSSSTAPICSSTAASRRWTCRDGGAAR